MGVVTFRPATEADARWMSPRLRKADRRELIASTGQPPSVTLAMSVAMGDALTGEIDGVPAAILGMPLTSHLPVTGCPWMVGTDDLEKHRVPVARASREVTDEWKKNVHLMVNYVDSRNRQAKVWLRWLGFTLEDARPYGPYGVPFHRFFWVS